MADRTELSTRTELSNITDLGGRNTLSTINDIIDSPAGFTYPVDLPVINIRDAGSFFELVGFDITAGMPTGKTYYVSTTGDEGNDGLTPETAIEHIWVAMQKPDVDVVSVAAGLYTRSFGLNGIAPTRDISVIVTGGEAISTTYDHLLWAPDGTFPDISKATRSSVWGVYDGSNLDANGDAEELTLVGSVAACDATSSSWYTDGVSVWVNPFDGRLADNDIWAFLNVKNARCLNTDFYIEGFELRGGTPSFDARSDGSVIQARAKACKFKYTRSGDSGGFRTQGAVASVAQDCTPSKNRPDGFNYHSIDVSHVPVALEINCIGRNNGIPSETINNGSSMHDGGTIIRINGKYKDNYGPNVVDVNDSFSWNLGTLAKDSLASSSDTDFQVDGDMWLDKGSVVGSSSTDNFVASTGAINYTNMGTITGTGTLNAYERTFK